MHFLLDVFQVSFAGCNFISLDLWDFWDSCWRCHGLHYGGSIRMGFILCRWLFVHTLCGTFIVAGKSEVTGSKVSQLAYNLSLLAFALPLPLPTHVNNV